MRHAVPFVLVAMWVGGMHAIPGSDFMQPQWMDALQVDKVIHVGLFAVLGVSGMIGLGKSGLLMKYRITASVACVGYGVALEFMQGALFEGRNADPVDALADAVGVAAGWVIYRLIYRGWPGES